MSSYFGFGKAFGNPNGSSFEGLVCGIFELFLASYVRGFIVGKQGSGCYTFIIKKYYFALLCKRLDLMRQQYAR